MEKNKINIIELFGGIGACSKALKRQGFDVNILDYVEIDKYAVKSYNAINNTTFEPQDIKNYDKTFDNVDLIIHGSPCQDFSLAGKQEGGDEGSGTRSSLLYESIRIINANKPKYVIWENVKNVLSKKHKHNFDEYINRMNELGYTSYYQVLNAKDYGIPQSRERVFTISIRNDLDKKFEFPQKQELKLKLKDMLEDNVDEKYYLSTDKIYKIANWKAYQKPFEKVQGNNSVCPTLTARGAGEEHSGMITYSSELTETTNLQKECMQTLDCQGGNSKEVVGKEECIGTYQYSKSDKFMKGKDRFNPNKDYSDTLQTTPKESVVLRNLKQELCDKLIEENKVKEMDVIRHSYSTSRMKSLYTQNNNNNNLSPTLDTRCDCLGVTTKEHSVLRIRKLTPKECWRLMGFDDIDYEKASQYNSNAQLYKQAGNSIVVNVLENIINNLLKKDA